MGVGLAVVVAVVVLIVPGALVGRAARLPWPVAVAVGPALTFGVVAAAIIPLGAVGISWNVVSAVVSLAVVVGVAAGLATLLARHGDRGVQDGAVSGWSAVTVGAGVVLGAVLIGLAAVRGVPQWQSVPSTWDAVWHANTIRFILETGQASSLRMGELRNVETQASLYYPNAFHALAAVLAQLTGAAPTTAYTVSSLAVGVWLIPASAATLTWHLLRARSTRWRTAGSAAAAAALSASFTAIPYVEFDVASMPNLAAYGLAAPTMVLIASTLAHRDRIPVAVLALLGVFSVHTTGGIVVAMFVVAWWLCDAVWRPVRGRLADAATLLLVAVPTAVLMIPQFIALLQQTEIIVGHEFVTGQSRKNALLAAVLQHTRHLNDYPVQYGLLALAAIGAVILMVTRVWWPLAVWLLLVAAIVHSSKPFGTVVGTVVAGFADAFYSDPRRLSAVITVLLAPLAGIALFTVVTAVLAVPRRVATRCERCRVGAPVWHAVTAALVVAVSVGYGWHYFPRNSYLFGQKYDSVMIGPKNLQAMAYLATLPGAHDTIIGNANIDASAWMYAVADLHPLWTHYDYPVQQGPGYHRFVFWAFADDADTDPRVAEAVNALNIRYVLVNSRVVKGFAMPDGLKSLDQSRAWVKIYDNGESRIYQWRDRR